MKLRISTSNIINGGPSIVRRPAFEKSNVELVNGLRANIAASRDAVRPTYDSIATNGHPVAAKSHIPYTLWTSPDLDVLHIPSRAFQTRGLSEERSQYDITVKLFILPKASFDDWRRYLRDAIAAVLDELDVETIDLLIVSFPGISFDVGSEEKGGCGSFKVEASDAELMDAVVEAWEEVELLQSRGIAMKIGVAEFGRDRLQQFLPRTVRKPTVDQINVRDCHVLPQSMMLFAKQGNIELLTHTDCTNILPQGTLREILGGGENGAGILADGGSEDEGLQGEVTPQWVVKYTAVVRDRGVIENKGYFASAELFDSVAQP